MSTVSNSAGLEASLGEILDCVAQPVWVVDHEGVIVFANPAAIEALGYERPEDLKDKPSHQTIHYKHPDGSHFPVEECPMLRPRQTGETIKVEEDWFVRADGTMFPVAYTSAPLELESGRGAVVAFADISERHRVERLLRQRDTILETVAQPVYVTDHQGVIRYVNPAAVSALGFDQAAELVGHNGHWLVHYKHPDGSEYPIEECQFTRMRERGESVHSGEDWFVRKDGSMALLAYAAAPIETSEGMGTVIAFTDVSERRAAERAARERDVAEARAAELEASEARQRAILEAALDCVISIDAGGRITYFNPAAERTFGYRADDIVGRELAEVVVPPSLRERHRQGLARYLATGEGRVLDRRIEITAMRADGGEFPVELSITRTPVPGGPVFTGHLRDITERKRAEEDLLAARRRVIEAADAERRRVTRDLHDGAQQDLVTVIANLQLAEQSWPRPDGIRERLEIAHEAADRGLLGLRELAAGMHPAILTNRGLAAALESLSRRMPLPVELLELPGDRLPEEIEASVYFFVSEALTNVVKHARASRATLRLTVDEGRMIVEVTDDGVGGASLDSTGTGLPGLADRIAALDGRFELSSESGSGTRLYAVVPLEFGS